MIILLFCALLFAIKIMNIRLVYTLGGNTFITLILFCTFFLTSCKYQPVEINIFHVNDIHGAIDQIPALSAELKKRKTKNNLVVSAGDLFSGNPYVDQYPEKGFPIIDGMNKIGFHYSALGNHEFDYGLNTLAQRIKQADFRFLCCNIYGQSDVVRMIKPYDSVTISGKKILLIGVLQTDYTGYPQTNHDSLVNISFSDGINAVTSYKSISERFDACIVLSHLGLQNDIRLAQQTNFIDIIIGGHSHSLIDTFLKINQSVIVQAGSNLDYLGMLTLFFDRHNKLSVSSEIISLTDYKEPDSLMIVWYNNFKKNNFLKTIIGFNKKTLYGNKEIGQLLTQAILFAGKADIALHPSGGVRLDSLLAGNISLETVYSLDPFVNEIVCTELPADSVNSLLQRIAGKKDYESVLYAGNVPGSQEQIQFPVPKNQKYLYKVCSGKYLYNKIIHSSVLKSTGVTTSEALIRYIQSVDTIVF